MIDGRFVFDLHGHGEGLMPEGSMLRSAETPKDSEIGHLADYGLDACALCAVGDPATFGIGKKNELGAILLQLEGLRSRVLASGGKLVTSAPDLAEAEPGDRPSLRALLGVEGLDFLEGKVGVIDTLHRAGVRLLGLVHYTASEIGGICMDLRGETGPGCAGGLSALGKAVIDAANERSMVIDVTHANDATILDAIARSRSPVVCSHTGPRALHPSPRYVPDSILLAIAESGGLVGLWPERYGNSGPADLGEFVAMVSHVADLCGPEALALGTDFNGVPGYAKGYRGPVDNAGLDEGLSAAGFSGGERAAILGGNARRVLATVLEG